MSLMMKYLSFGSVDFADFHSAIFSCSRKPFNACCRPDSKEVTKIKPLKKQPTNPASSDCDTLIDSTKLVHPVRVNYEKKW